MPIIQTVSQYDFHRAFLCMNRAKQMGGAAGCDALFDYLDDIYDDNGETLELDVIGLCCEFSQYEDKDAMLSDYGVESVEELDALMTVITYTETVLEGTKLVEYERYIVHD